MVAIIRQFCIETIAAIFADIYFISRQTKTKRSPTWPDSSPDDKVKVTRLAAYNIVLYLMLRCCFMRSCTVLFDAVLLWCCTVFCYIWCYSVAVFCVGCEIRPLRTCLSLCSSDCLNGWLPVWLTCPSIWLLAGFICMCVWGEWLVVRYQCVCLPACLSLYLSLPIYLSTYLPP